MLENLRNELIGKEMSLLEMDNLIINLLDLNDTASIFNEDCIYYAFENMSQTYTINETNYNVEFELIEENEYKQDIIIKIINIDLI